MVQLDCGPFRGLSQLANRDDFPVAIIFALKAIFKRQT